MLRGEADVFARLKVLDCYKFTLVELYTYFRTESSTCTE